MEQGTANNQFEEKATQIPANYESREVWVNDVRRKRATLLDKRHARKQRKQDLAKRRTVAAQERMRIISQLARKDKDDDDFGMRDEDWDVYKTISKDGDSDSDAENEKLIEYETILRHNDPTYDDPQSVATSLMDANQVNTAKRKKTNSVLNGSIHFKHLFKNYMESSWLSHLRRKLPCVVFPLRDSFYFHASLLLAAISRRPPIDFQSLGNWMSYKPAK